jgi:DNA mismatch repair protein MutS2
MDSHALEVIEFPRVLEIAAGRATSELGALRVLALSPVPDRGWIDREHSRVAAVRAATTGENPWHPEPIHDISGAIARLRVEGSRWSAEELLAGSLLMRAARRTRESLGDTRRPPVVLGVLGPLLEPLVDARDVEEAVERAISEDGSVRDSASPRLRSIRRELRSAHGELVRILEGVIARLESHHRVQDMSVTVRGGRYVIPVRREGRGSVGGIVHDSSSSGATLFVEPPAAIEFGNRIREFEAEEVEEIERILIALTDAVRPHRLALAESLDSLAELDSLHARARFAADFGCSTPSYDIARKGFSIIDGRHPLLLARQKDGGHEVVPFSLAMEATERTLLISGPNTGGKTVLLKAVGLLSAMVQSGIPIPAHPESRVAVFDDVYADIGDEQSIEASLSTFSSHLKNLSEILRLATADSLVLIDELGSGTDPQEGAALGWAILEELTGRGATTLATTHLGTLKELASQDDAVINASLQFDSAALAPTYRLIKGVPGRSYGISIARRLALPERIVARAEERMPQQERDVASLIERLEVKEADLEHREREARAVLEDGRRRIQEVIRREQNVRAREREAERASRQEARRYLLDARAKIDRTISELRQKGAEQLEEAARSARREAEQLAASEGAHLDRLSREEANAARRSARGDTGARVSPARGATPEEGDAVSVGTLGGRAGRLLEIRGDHALVAVGAVKLTVPLATLELTEGVAVEPVKTIIGDIPEPEARTEVDLRGMRVDEVDGALMNAIDAAIRADLPAMRIIHGKGTGALRDRVTEMLRKDTRVTGFRLGAWNEGGTGVTVAELK